MAPMTSQEIRQSFLDYFAQHGPPQGGTGTDITDADGIVYRYFARRCFEFHPLANFSALNARVARKDARVCVAERDQNRAR